MMARSLVIVESPAKAKTIQKILGKGFQVLSSMGHVMDLPKSRLGVDVEHGFAPTYVVIKDRKKTLGEILTAARGARKVLLAPDPDREGEAIAWHIAESIRSGAGGGKRKKGAKEPEAKAPPDIVRVLFHEITKKGIAQGMAEPRDLDRRKYDSQQARRILDRLVGYSLSPLLWAKVRRGLSAGRVQSVAVKMVCDRERAIQAFVPEEYWSLTARFSGSNPPPFLAKLVEAGGRKVRPRTEEETAALLRAVEAGPFFVRDVRKKARRRNSPPPFTTSKLQQEAARTLRMPAYRTMMVAQSLYEGVDIPGSGLVGLITYMRTDSVRVAAEAIEAVRDHIRGKYGERYLPESPNFFRNRKSSQDAHEAIRPTSMDHPPSSLKKILGRDQMRLYELVWNRFVASQMAPAEFEQTTIDVACAPPAGPQEGYLFRASGSIPRFPGYLELYQDNGKFEPQAGADEKTNGENGEAERGSDEGNVLPELSVGERLALLSMIPAQHFTQPPPRFTESALIKELEEQGIGRPSTYAAIVKTIKDRGYVRLEEGKFIPSDLGTVVTQLLEESFPRVMDVAFTARMEEELDQIEEGERELVQALDDFYQPFSEELDRAKLAMPRVKEEPIPTGIACEICGGEMVIRNGRAGRFLACRNFPECRNTSNFRETPDGKIELVKNEAAGVDCDKCGKPMVVRRWKGARYIACSGYPECKNSRPYPTGIKCPECGSGEVVERTSRAGKLFFSCSRYPDCRFAAWNRPIAAACPVCGYPAMAEKVRRGGGTEIVCLRKGCKGKKGENALDVAG
ncbi:MAG: type I DNA topoisomerase [Deltaproteobacteria bacterium]|nr:type I DNA topoisomerase [Deltaproteobacteria bacterium]